MKLHLYKLNRKKDVSGVSGTGEVAYAIGIPSGKVIMWWNTEIQSVTHYDSIENVRDVHSHEGASGVEEILDPAKILELFGLNPDELLKKKRGRKKGGTKA